MLRVGDPGRLLLSSGAPEKEDDPVLETNRSRDRDTDRQLDAAGWSVLRIWEHEDPEAAAARVQRLYQELVD